MSARSPGRARGHRTAVLLLCGAIATLESRGAHAAAARVVLLQPTAPSPGARRCLRLIREELVASGFDVAVVDGSPDQDPLSLATTMRAQQGVVATIGLLGAPESPRAELWILDRLGGTPEVRRLPFPADEPERGAEVLAIRAVEVLRASALKLLIEAGRTDTTAREPSAASGRADTPAAPTPVASPPRAPAASVQAAGSANAPREPRRRVVALETGVSLLTSPGELDPAAIPLLRLRLSVAGPWMARVTVAGLGTRPRVETARGTAMIAQTIGVAEVGLTFRGDRRLLPSLSLAGGVLHVGSEARGAESYIGQRGELWSALIGAGGGLGVAMTQGLALSLEAHVVFASPYPVVRFVDWRAATLARPALWVTLTLVSWL